MVTMREALRQRVGEAWLQLQSDGPARASRRLAADTAGQLDMLYRVGEIDGKSWHDMRTRCERIGGVM